VKLRRVTMRFISDPAAQVAALLSGDVDAFPRVSAARSLKQFETNKKFQVLVGGSRAKTILAINNKRKPLDDVRVRRAIAPPSTARPSSKARPTALVCPSAATTCPARRATSTPRR
jgi:hypothetical protein